MVNAQQVQNGSVQIVDMHRITSDVVAEIVSLTHGFPLLDPGTSQPDWGRRKGVRNLLTSLLDETWQSNLELRGLR